MHLQMDPLDNPQSTRPIHTGRDYSKELYLNGWFGYIDNRDRQFGPGSVPTWTRTRSDSPEPLLTLITTHRQNGLHKVGRSGLTIQFVSPTVVDTTMMTKILSGCCISGIHIGKFGSRSARM